MSPGRRRLAAALGVAFALAAGGCDRLLGNARSPFQGVDITGSAIGEGLRLPDHNGQMRSLADYRGRAVVVTFGYTHCPDVCPTTLADLAAAMKRLEGDAREVQVLFVTVDPRRDTPELLRQYVPAFNPSFLGLRGDAAQTARVAKEFGIYFAEKPGASPDSYTVDHSAQTFVFDRRGKARLVWAPGTSPTAMASDLRLVLNS